MHDKMRQFELWVLRSPARKLVDILVCERTIDQQTDSQQRHRFPPTGDTPCNVKRVRGCAYI
jgi:hypothetical protein